MLRMTSMILLWSVITILSAPCQAADRPNFVFIMADDLGWGDVAFHDGNAPTPHLDKLVSDGLELTQHYVAPVCSPTRTGLLTGRCWSRFDVTTPQNDRALPWDTVTLARALKSVGYDTCLTGKWHLGSLPEWGPNHFGFDHSYGSLAGGVGPYDHHYKKGPYTETWHRNETRLTEQGHVTDLITDEACQWIAQRSDRPFFLYVPYTAVHLPVKEPDEWLARVPKSIKGDVPRHYAACIMHLDDSVGRIIDALEKAQKRDNTLLVFTSDNGGSWVENNDTKYPADDYPEGDIPGNNKPLRGHKAELYEGGIRVPTVVSWPGQVSHGKCETPLQITDWMPTFCALAGYDPEQDLKWDGSNISQVLLKSAERPDHPLYWAGVRYRSQAVRSGDWKLLVHKNGKQDQVELFNLADDPGETKNLAETHPEKVAQLQKTLQEISSSDKDATVKKK